MSSKGLHTIIDSLINLIREGYYFHLHVAGNIFQSDYYDDILSSLSPYAQQIFFHFYGHLTPFKLARFWQLCQIGIFPSIYPEALVLFLQKLWLVELFSYHLVSVVPGLFHHNHTGFLFQHDSVPSLSDTIKSCLTNSNKLLDVASKGNTHVVENFDVAKCTDKLETIYLQLYLDTHENFVAIVHYWNPNGNGTHQSLRPNPSPRVQTLKAQIQSLRRLAGFSSLLHLEDRPVYRTNASSSIDIDIKIVTDGCNHVLSI